MGRGARSFVRWKNDRKKKKNERAKRQAEATGQARKAGANAGQPESS